MICATSSVSTFVVGSCANVVVEHAAIAAARASLDEFLMFFSPREVDTRRFRLLGHQQANHAVALVQDEQLAVVPDTHAHVGPRCGVAALGRILVSNQL